MNALKFSIILPLALLILSGTTGATEYHASRTGRQCAECHQDSSGGGDLTPLGETFRKNGYVLPPDAPKTEIPASPASKAVKFSLGFLHLLAGVSWLGTIFYVHIVLKPKYAVGGLPKTEMRIAWTSIAVLGATGLPLTIIRYQDFATLLHTRSGVFLLIKIGLYIFLLLSAAYATLVLSPKLKARRAAWQKNNGLDGNKSWVKVGDLLYDFSESRRWVNGNHFGRHQAGTDLTEALKSAPHGPEKLEKFPSFSIAGKALAKESAAISTLYVMAYVNLIAALGVLVSIALLRWG